jgi:mycothiol synthase
MTTLHRRPSASHLHVPRLHVTVAADPGQLQAVWAASQDADDPASRPRDGWWSVVDWASTICPLTMNGQVIGLAAVHVSHGDDVAEGRLALVPDRRTRCAGTSLVNAALGLARAGGAERLRLVIPRAARWAGEAARHAGFETVRATHVMLRPLSAGPMASPNLGAVRVRPLRPGEEPALLAALNRAWSGTWGFSPIPPAALAHDLDGQREGMLVAVEAADDSRIVATVHAIVDRDARNLDGGPHAWISNLTTDPDWRGRGLGRLMLARGVNHLREWGAGSVMLGVDGGNDAAVRLYRSAGFDVMSTTAILERPLDREVIDR